MGKRKIRVIHYGLGPIGLETAKLVLKKSNMIIVGAIDVAKDMVGKDLGEILHYERKLDVAVTDRPRDLFATVDADVVIHTAGSRIKTIYSQLDEIVAAGLNVISSSEELLFPYTYNAELAKELDMKAKERGVTILGTGVNPGFVMDALPLYLTGVCQEVYTIRVERIVDAGTRRYPLQRKIGVGLSEVQFREQVAQKALGHVGLVESLQFIVHYLGLSCDHIEETIDPVIAARPEKTEYFDLKEGDVLGIKHIVTGIKDGETIINLDLRMYVGADNPHDAIYIEGIPNISLRIEGGVAGDQATAAVLVNSTPEIVNSVPGLATVEDLPAPHFFQ